MKLKIFMCALLIGLFIHFYLKGLDFLGGISLVLTIIATGIVWRGKNK